MSNQFALAYQSRFRHWERDFFRVLNKNLEPKIRKGLGSSKVLPYGLIVLESTGHISGQTRRTPLVALKIGRCTLVATGRGERSFWVKNLQQQPRTRYYLHGNARDARAIVLAPDSQDVQPGTESAAIEKLIALLKPLTKIGWAFALLTPD